MVLWKKESDNACYIDLLPPDQVDAFNLELIILACKNTRKNDVDSIAHREKGNESFRMENFADAYRHYNDSIRFAPNESENLGLGYANRAACYLKLKRYDKCLADIELAIKSNYPKHLMPKLDKRKEDCLNEMKGAAKHYEKMSLELSYNSNKKFPGMANILEVRSNDEFGKHVIAKRDIDVGKIVLLEDAFFGADFDQEIICKTCAKRIMNFIPCSSCSDVMFCNTKCHASNDLHKKFCGALYNRQYRFMLDVELVLNAVSAFQNAASLMKFVENSLATRDLDLPECESDGQAKYRLFLKLFAIRKDLSAATKDIFATYNLLLEIPQIKQFFHSKQEKRFLMHLIWQHRCILRANSFRQNQRTDGTGFMNIIGISSSLFNHSCVPNTLHSFYGNKVIAMTQRPVKKGEQLFINYFKGGNDSVTNGKEIHNFECKCSKCVRCWKPEDRKRIQSDANYSFLVKNFANHDGVFSFLQAQSIKPKIYKLLQKYGRLPWSPEFEIIEKRMEDLFALDLLPVD